MNDDAIMPTRASKRSAGLDLYSSIDVCIKIGSIKKINTGIRKSLPENTYGSIRDKSSLAAKGLLTLGGLIDNDYTGEVIIIMTSLIESIKIKKGHKIAQLIVSNIMYPEIKLVKFLKNTERNDKGFGEMDTVTVIYKILKMIYRISNYKRIEIFLVQLSWSIISFNKRRQIVHFHLIMSVFRVLISIKQWARVG